MAVEDLDKQPDSVSSVLKVFGILNALGDERDIGISELAQKVMMSKSTVYRFLQTMKSLGYVSQEEETEKYSLTVKLFELGSKALQNVDVIRYANGPMRELSRKTKETIHLGALDDDAIIYIHKIDSQYNLRMYSRIGRRNPIHSTAIGKVLMAWCEPGLRDETLNKITFSSGSSKAVHNKADFLPMLEQARAQGYAEDVEEQEEGLRCIAVPVFDRFGTVSVGLSLSLPTVRFSEEEKPALIALLHMAARNISSQMGYHDYPF